MPKGLQFLADLYWKIGRHQEGLQTQLEACVEKMKAYDDVLLFPSRFSSDCSHSTVERAPEQEALSENTRSLIAMQAQLQALDQSAPETHFQILQFNSKLTQIKVASEKHNEVITVMF